MTATERPDADARRRRSGRPVRRRRASAPTSTTRVEAFSDGVFAIAITLLVLELHVPDAADAARAGGLVPALAMEWPSFLAYLAAFATIGAVWLNHHAAFQQIARVDRTVLGWNLLLLLAASFIPFPTALVADHLADGAFSDGARVATAAYAVVGVACCLPWLVVYRHLERNPRLLEDPSTVADIRAERVRGWVGVVGFAAAAVLAVLVPVAAIAAFIAGSAYYALTASGPVRRDGAGRARPAAEASSEVGG